MAKLVFGMNQSLDGYVDHMAFAPSPTLFRHFIEEAQGLAGSVYGRQMYEVMRYWDDDRPVSSVNECFPNPSFHKLRIYGGLIIVCCIIMRREENGLASGQNLRPAMRKLFLFNL